MRTGRAKRREKKREREKEARRRRRRSVLESSQAGERNSVNTMTKKADCENDSSECMMTQ